MPVGNSYPAPNLPLNGTEQLVGFQQQGAIVATVTLTIAQIAASVTAVSFASPAPIGNVAPNTGAFTDLTVTEYLNTSVTTGIVASGASQSTATLLTTQMNVVNNVGSGTGVLLEPVSAGTFVRVFHRASGGNTLSVYPPSGQQIEALGTNSPSSMIYGQSNDYCYVGSNLWLVK